MRPSFLAFVSVVAAACTSAQPGTTRVPSDLGPYDRIPYAAGPPPSDARVFLVAGGDDIANFAQEVVQQRVMWRRLGVSDEQIACYYAKPTAAAYRADRGQYRRLAGKLRSCFPANPATIRAHLIRVAAERPPFVYLYVTGHGTHSFLRVAPPPGARRACRERPQMDPEERALLDEFALGLNADPGPALGDVCGVLRGHRLGLTRGDLMFSPPTLRETLDQFPVTTRKIIVLQGCFTGGFVGRGPGRSTEHLITNVANLIALTATRHDRPSFGCGPGDVTSYFGGVFNRTLARYTKRGDRPVDVDWRRVHIEVASKIESMERAAGERPSHPQLFVNTDRSR